MKHSILLVSEALLSLRVISKQRRNSNKTLTFLDAWSHLQEGQKKERERQREREREEKMRVKERKRERREERGERKKEKHQQITTYNKLKFSAG